jgi:phenylacetate-CoA ligase
MIAYPTSLESLAGHLRAQGLSLDIPVILTQAEVLSDYCRELATEVFRAAVVDEYGHAERVVKANSFAPHAYRFVPGYSFIELIPSAANGLWEVIGTGLFNRAMPLVRYRTGDLVELPADADESYVRAVELGRADFVRVCGRSGDYLLSPEGVRLMGIDHIPRGVSSVIQSQVVQDGHSVTFRIVPAASFSEVDLETLLQNARKKLPNSMDVRIELVDMLERTTAGKTPYVIRRGPDDQRKDRGL